MCNLFHPRPRLSCILVSPNFPFLAGHSKGVSSVGFIPGTGHLLLTASLDTKCKVWGVVDNRQVSNVDDTRAVAAGRDADRDLRARSLVLTAYFRSSSPVYDPATTAGAPHVQRPHWRRASGQLQRRRQAVRAELGLPGAVWSARLHFTWWRLHY
jgi:WD40 repeat protein